MKVIWIVFLMLMIQPGTKAQENITLSGYVKDRVNQKSLPGVNIYISSDWKMGTITNEEGYFNWEVPIHYKKGNVVFSFIGYKERWISIDSLGLLKEIWLEPAIVNIKETVVKGKRIIAEEFTIRQIKKMDVYLNPAAKADPLLAVSSLPGSTTLDESANVSFRGSSPAETGIFLNGVPVNDAVRFSQLNGIGTFSIFNTAIIERIQIYPGNPPLEFGNSTAGIVSIETDNNLPEISSQSLSLSLASMGGYLTGRMGKNSAITLFGNYQPSEIFTFVNEKALKDLTDFYSMDAGLNYLYKWNNKGYVKLFNYANTEGYKYWIRDPSYEGNSLLQKKRNLTVANVYYPLKNAEITFNAGFNVSKSRYAFGNLDMNVANFDNFYSLNYQYFFSALSVKSGLSYFLGRTHPDGTLPQFSYALNPFHPIVIIDETKFLHLIEGYSYAKYYLSEKWILGLGTRLGTNSLHKKYLSLQANLHVKIQEPHSINFALGKYHKVYYDRNINNYELLASKQISLDYQYKHQRNEISVSVFYKEAQNMYNDHTAYGIETFIQRRIGQRVQIQFSYTYLQAEGKMLDTREKSAYDLDYYFRAFVKYNPVRTFDISLVWLYRQGAWYTPVNDVFYDETLQVYQPLFYASEQLHLPDYAKLDLSLSKFFWVSDRFNLITFFSVNNLFNRKNSRTINYNETYSESFTEPFSKRIIYAGVVFNF